MQHTWEPSPAAPVGRNSVRTGLIMVGCIVGLTVIGGLLGNYAPLFGGILEFGRPGSPARMTLAYQHAVAGGILGVILGLLVVLIRRRPA